jgi:hypothetical protein
MFNNNIFNLILLKLTNKINNDLYNNLILIKYARIEYKYKRCSLKHLFELQNKNNRLLQTNKYIKYYLYT